MGGLKGHLCCLCTIRKTDRRSARRFDPTLQWLLFATTWWLLLLFSAENADKDGNLQSAWAADLLNLRSSSSPMSVNRLPEDCGASACLHPPVASTALCWFSKGVQQVPLYLLLRSCSMCKPPL